MGTKKAEREKNKEWREVERGVQKRNSGRNAGEERSKRIEVEKSKDKEIRGKEEALEKGNKDKGWIPQLRR